MSYVNKTRRSTSIPKKLLKKKQLHLLFAYGLMKLSYLGNEGIENSGSYLFADHIYQAKPVGKYGFGKLIDSALLQLPSSRSFRNRYRHSRDNIVKAVITDGKKIIVSVPSGIPRDVVEAAKIIRQQSETVYRRTKFICIDLDPDVKQFGTKFANQEGVNIDFVTADAFDKSSYPEKVDFISSLGFTEFLDDGLMLNFLNHCHDILMANGQFVSSCTMNHKLSTYLMKNVGELEATYRELNQVEQLLNSSKLTLDAIAKDKVGYQVLYVARKV